MGGTGIALADPFGVSRINPASYPFLGHTTFEMGVTVRNLSYTSDAISTSGHNTRLQGLSLGVPFGKGKWGLALGVHPVTTVSYKITDVVAVEGGDASLVYSGNGGLDRVYIGLGRVIWQGNDTVNRGGKLSVGANLDYLFGKVEGSRKAYYPSGGGYYNTSVANTFVVRSPMASAGLQYAADLVDPATARMRMRARKARLQERDAREEMDWLNAGRDPKERKPVKLPKGEGEALRFRIGLCAELPASLAARNTLVANSFLIGSTGVEFPRDTAQFIDGVKGQLNMPAMFGFGIALSQSHWTFTAEHRRRDWSQLSVDVEGYTMHSELSGGASYAMGATYRPSGDARGNFFSGANYRMGARYANDYLVVNGSALDQMAVSFGASFPVMGTTTRSRLNIGAELGRRGDTSNGLLLERYADIFIGITITPDLRERWFKKKRID